MYSTWTEINTKALQDNIAILRQASGVEVMAVVKANAYGHGAIACALAALQGGATFLGVARIEEALELRHVYIQAPVLLLGYTPIQRFEEAISANLSVTVWSPEQVQAAAAAARQAGKPGRVHIKVDTGMSRLGLAPAEAAHLARRVSSEPDLILEGIFTHFARADEPGQASVDEQEGQFAWVIDALQAEGLRPPFVHAANSAAIITRASAQFNLVRAGIAMYGMRPSSQVPLPGGFQPVLAWKSVISQVKDLPPGTGISYGHAYVTTEAERIGTIPVGYADGLRRVSGNVVLIGGQRAPVVGRVCMDQIMVSLRGVPAAAVMDEVVMIGRQGDDEIRAEEVGERWGTINYEVTCDIGPRVPRIILT